MKRTLAALVLSVPLLSAHASEYPTDAEIAYLPDYCRVKLKESGTPQERAAMERFGPPNWIHMHHYCAALNLVKRAQKASNQGAAVGYLKMAAGQYEYVNKGFLPDFWMRPQLYVEYGQVLLRLKDHATAAHYFAEAIKLSPGYAAAYLPLINTYRDLAMKPAALDVATAGLRQFPESQALQKAYLELGGTKPFPEPVRAATEEKSHAGSASKDQAGEVAQSTPSSADKDAAVIPAHDAKMKQESVPENGCRFCPPEEIREKWRESFGETRKQ